jgi:hypothetical protein
MLQFRHVHTINTDGQRRAVHHVLNERTNATGPQLLEPLHCDGARSEMYTLTCGRLVGACHLIDVWSVAGNPGAQQVGYNSGRSLQRSMVA